MLDLVENGTAPLPRLDHHVIAAQAAFQGVGDGLGLLVDLLEHVVAVFALVTGIVGQLGLQLLGTTASPWVSKDARRGGSLRPHRPLPGR